MTTKDDGLRRGAKPGLPDDRCVCGHLVRLHDRYEAACLAANQPAWVRARGQYDTWIACPCQEVE